MTFFVFWDDFRGLEESGIMGFVKKNKGRRRLRADDNFRTSAAPSGLLRESETFSAVFKIFYLKLIKNISFG